MEKVQEVAVLLAAYNGMKWIDEQVNSILNQEGVSVTIFISVDISSDGTEAWADQLALLNSRVKVLPHGKKFGCAAKNFYRLIRDTNLSKFDYIAFSDQDDIWSPNKLQRAYEALSSSEFDAYSSSITALWPDGRNSLINKAYPQKKWDFIFESAGPGCTFMLTGKLFLCFKRFIESNWETVQKINMHDWLCYAFSRSVGSKWFIDSQSLMLYRQHENNEVGANVGFSALIYRFKQFISGYWLSHSLLIAETIGLSETPFIKGWSELNRLQMLRLAFNAHHCRRRFRDQVLFVLVCCISVLTGQQKFKY